MNCDTCQSLLLDYLEGALHAEATRQVEAHAAVCPVCRIELVLAQQIESTLSGQELRMPPADFTTRVLSALPAARSGGETLWSQMLTPMASAASIVALILGLSQYLPDLSRLYETWSDRLSAAQEVVGDALSAMTAYGVQLQGLYSANAPTVHLTLAVLALVWVVYDHWQEAQA
jgi:hypothetical protein